MESQHSAKSSTGRGRELEEGEREEERLCEGRLVAELEGFLLDFGGGEGKRRRGGGRRLLRFRRLFRRLLWKREGREGGGKRWIVELTKRNSGELARSSFPPSATPPNLPKSQTPSFRALPSMAQSTDKLFRRFRAAVALSLQP